MNALVKHIAAVLTLCVVSGAIALRYTHDVSHGDRGSACGSDTAEGCSLCWFVQHQMAGDIGPLPDIVEPRTEPVSVGQKAKCAAFVPLRFVLRESNKDPPGSFAHENPKIQFVTDILSVI